MAGLRSQMAGRASLLARWTLAVAMMVALLSALPLRGVEAATTTVQVGQQSGGAPASQFNASVISINTGDTAHWLWFDGFHTVVSYAETAATPDWQTPSPLTASGQSFDHVFASNGTFTYYCNVHAVRSDADPANINASLLAGKMVGKITVATAVVGGVSHEVDAAALPVSRSPSAGARWPLAVSGLGIVVLICVAVAGWRLRRGPA